ncbi:hypothetical protein O3P69_020212 [Scylla paramamosain]|uniref:Uncharacterized protein n=1 Tax=Scylla paramamosain TaxID=85552 RepID=A0AAW0TND7_SCYPA
MYAHIVLRFAELNSLSVWVTVPSYATCNKVATTTAITLYHAVPCPPLTSVAAHTIHYVAVSTRRQDGRFKPSQHSLLLQRQHHSLQHTAHHAPGGETPVLWRAWRHHLPMEALTLTPGAHDLTTALC